MHTTQASDAAGHASGGTMTRTRVATSVLILVLLCALTFFAGLGRSAMTDADEAYYAEAGREMLEQGDWLTPHYNYQFRFQKPVLYYWFVAGTYAVAGVNAASARFWSAVAGLALVLLTWSVGRRLYDERTGLVGGMVAATCFGYFSVARMALPDLPLAFFVTATIWAGWRALVDHGGHPLRWLVLAGLSAGLGMLTKGPVALVLPAAVLGPIWLFEWRRRPLRFTHLLAAATVCAAVSLPWYVAMAVEHPDYLASFFVGDNLERFATTRFNEPRSVWYYLPVVLGGLLPWTPFLLLAVAPFAAVLRRRRPLSRHTAYLNIWWLAPLLIYTVSVGKQSRYVLPVLPPLAILMARALVSRLAARAGRPGRDPLVALAGGLSGIVLVVIGLLFYLFQPLLVDIPPAVPVAIGVIVSVLGALVGLVSSSPRMHHALPWVLAVASAIALAGVQYGALSTPGPEPVQQVASLLRRHLQPGDQWTAYGYQLFVRNLVFYVGSREAGPFGEERHDDELRALARFLEDEPRVYAVIREEDLGKLETFTSLKLARLGEVRYFNTATITLEKLLWPDTARDIKRVVVVRNR